MISLPEAIAYDNEVFRAELRSICGNFDVKQTSGQSHINGHLSVRQSAGIDIACVGLDAKLVSRGPADIRQDPGDYYFLILQNKGKSGIIQNDKEIRLSPGDMAIVDAASTSQFHYTNGYSAQVSVHLPRDEMKQRFGRRINGGIAIPQDDMLGIALRSILNQLMSGENNSELHIREAFFSVLGAYLTEHQKGCVVINPDRQLVNRSIALMNEHYSDSAFSTAKLADMMGISVRRLQRAFKLTDETAHSRLQSIRIEHAFQTLAKRTEYDRKTNVSTIAYSCGFNDLSTFYRRFKDRYHFTPTDHSSDG